MAWSDVIPLPENRAARLAVRRLARRPRHAAPLTLHGPPGTGKSLLLTALAADFIAQSTRTVLSVAAADLPEPDPAEPDALAPARSADLLLVEDLQHLKSAVALGSLLDFRGVRRRPTVVTAVAGPGQLPALPLRLRSRLAGGLVVGLEPFGPASRRQLLAELAERRKVKIRPEVLDWLAARPGNARHLIGHLNRLEQIGRGRPEPQTLAAVKAALAEPPAGARPLDEMAHLVARHFAVEPKLLRGATRQRQALWARQVAMFLARELIGLPLAAIGAYFGGRDHSTVLHACRKVEAARTANGDVAAELRRLSAEAA